MINEKINFLVKNIPDLIKKFDYRKGPDLYFYKRVMGERRKRPLEELFDDNYFIPIGICVFLPVVVSVNINLLSCPD